MIANRHVNWLTLRRTYSSWSREEAVSGNVITGLMEHAKSDTTLSTRR
jgi:hypothetical protein